MIDLRKYNEMTSATPGNALGGDLRYYLFANMAQQPGLVHGIFTRQGGKSRPPFSSLNIGLGIGDRTDAVVENRRRVAACLGGGALIFSNQVHEDGIRVIRDGGAELSHNNEVGDAMVTDVPGICLAIQVADCQAVVLYDPDRAVVANVHSGWRGSIINIIGRTVETMTAAFGCDPGNLLAGVGPSLGPCCAEFVNYQQEIPENLWSYRVSKDHFDFWAMSRDQLHMAGVPNENIDIMGYCTRCHPEQFFSYRAERVTGRFVVAAGLINGKGQKVRRSEGEMVSSGQKSVVGASEGGGANACRGAPAKHHTGAGPVCSPIKGRGPEIGDQNYRSQKDGGQRPEKPLKIITKTRNPKSPKCLE